MSGGIAAFRLEDLPLDEALRYSGCPEPTGVLLALAKSCGEELLAAVAPRWNYLFLTPESNGGQVVFQECGLVLPGADLAALLALCEKAALMCGTLGTGVDALLRRTQLTDMARGLVMEGCADALIEVLCDRVQAEIEAQFPGKGFTMRYSPGYGDLPLTVQKELLAVLDAPRRVGLCATENCILTPRKSVTAVLGILPAPAEAAKKRGCDTCNLRETCQFRKQGITCGK